MKRFVWRLQRVLDIKEKEEQVKKAELLELIERLADTQGALITQKRILENVISHITGKNLVERLGEQEFFLKYSAASDEKIKTLENEVVRLESQQRKKIAEVLSVRRLKEGLDKLRTEARRQFIKEQEKLEQKELDEGVGISFARKIIRQNKVGNARS
jgi:flagellar biosynthesis chaperone FliJ